MGCLAHNVGVNSTSVQHHLWCHTNKLRLAIIQVCFSLDYPLLFQFPEILEFSQCHSFQFYFLLFCSAETKSPDTCFGKLMDTKLSYLSTTKNACNIIISDLELHIYLYIQFIIKEKCNLDQFLKLTCIVSLGLFYKVEVLSFLCSYYILKTSLILTYYTSSQPMLSC